MLISSFSSERFKQIRRLTARRERERTGSYFVGGVYLVTEALSLNVPVELLVLAPEILKKRPRPAHQHILERCMAPRLEVSAEIFENLAPLHIHHGVAAVLSQRWTPLKEIEPRTTAGWIVLDNVGYPANLGTMLRISDAAGAGGIILVGNTADPYEPAAVSASLGAVISQHLVRTNVEALQGWKQQYKLTFVGTSPTGSTDYRVTPYECPVILCMGSEHLGMSAECRSLCDTMVYIPMLGRCESHNVAVATAIVLYEALNQHPTFDRAVTAKSEPNHGATRAPPFSHLQEDHHLRLKDGIPA